MTESDPLQDQARLVRALLDPARYPHPVETVEHIETHISHVLLAGDFAYKIKKPLNLGFLDFSRLDDRAHYCAEEVRLNGRLAADIYLRAIPITGSPEAPRLDGVGDAIEFAVLMRRFAQDDLLDRRFARNELELGFMDTLAERIAAFHAVAAQASPENPYGQADTVVAPMRENFTQFAPFVAETDMRARLERLADWTETRFHALQDTLTARHKEGFVRECHGDMHLANMALCEDRLIIFDGIEFNPGLRWIDVMSDIAFVTMDLEARGAPEYAHRLLDAYLQHTGDYAGLATLRFYQVYRCMVRAKVNAIRAAQEGLSESETRGASRNVERYLSLAEAYTQRPAQRLVLTHGFSGSGKTTLSQTLIETHGYVRLRSDVERKRLHGLDAAARTGSALGSGLYAAGATSRTYTRLTELAEVVLRAGFGVIVDATFLKRVHREPFLQLAERLGVPLSILDVQGERALLEVRIRQRLVEARDASEADLNVLAQQFRQAEPLGPTERRLSITVDASGPLPAEALAALAPSAS